MLHSLYSSNLEPFKFLFLSELNFDFFFLNSILEATCSIELRIYCTVCSNQFSNIFKLTEYSI